VKKPLLLIAAVLSMPPLLAGPLTFEDLSDGELLGSQYPGMTWAGAIVLTAGISLNEFEFPPYSGSHVASDYGGPMSVSFAAPVMRFAGYFTYAWPLTLIAFDALDNPVASAVSAFWSNLALSGDPGSSPNEWLAVEHSWGIHRALISADPSGGSFTLDDASILAIPEPGTLGLGLIVLVGLAISCPRRCRGRSGAAVATMAPPLLAPLLVEGQTLPGPYVTKPLLSATPSAVTVGQRTLVVVTADAGTNPAILRESVKLPRYSSAATLQADLGRMYDDATHGDVAANDGVYTAQVDLLEPTPGPIFLRASVAYRWTAERALSSFVPVVVYPASDPMRCLREAAHQLELGNTAAAAAWFTPKPRNSYRLSALSAPERLAYAAAFRQARLIEQDEFTQTYSTSIQGPSGSSATLVILLVRSESGDWLINQW